MKIDLKVDTLEYQVDYDYNSCLEKAVETQGFKGLITDFPEASQETLIKMYIVLLFCYINHEDFLTANH